MLRRTMARSSFTQCRTRPSESRSVMSYTCVWDMHITVHKPHPGWTRSRRGRQKEKVITSRAASASR